MGTPPKVVDTLRAHRRTLATAGLAIVAFQIVRGSRQAIIPLWGTTLGLDAREIGLLFSLSAGAEVLMFYPVGRMMDLRGRRSTAIPSLTLLSLGVAAIPFTTNVVTLGIVVAIVGFANGLGTGINMTLSSDLSPDHGRSVFLGIWRTITDAGTASGPTLVAVAASLASLSLAGVVVSLFGFGGVFLLWRVVPETLRTE
jgi:MFS family permease